MKSLSLKQAKDQLETILADVEAGEEVIVTRDGAPVVKIVRFSVAHGSSPSATDAKEREAALQEMVDLMRKSRLKLGGWRFTRDEMHER